tara:strand:+ start:41 stop:157 length:117 start_codon:yes stop_codon:yes gene_type:complete
MGGFMMNDDKLAELIMNWYDNISEESLDVIDELLEDID